VQDDLEQHIAQLLAQGAQLVRRDRVVRLVRLLQEVAREGLVGAVRAVVHSGPQPRVTARRDQPVHDGHDVEQPRTGRVPRPVHELQLGQTRPRGQSQPHLAGERLIAAGAGQPHHRAVSGDRVEQRRRIGRPDRDHGAGDPQ
jgi:hypothetical protein